MAKNEKDKPKNKGKDKKRLPMNHIHVTAYRFFGMIGSTFTLFQSAIWFFLGFGGAICKYTACGSKAYNTTFKYCFYLMYYYEKPANETANVTRLNYISPNTFHGIMWITVLISIANIAISMLTAKAFIEWMDQEKIKKMACIWSRSLLAFSAVELIIFIIFFSDSVAIKQNKEIKCFLKKDLASFLSSDATLPSPAPYLLHLTSNLKTMQRKIKKLKRNLLFLDAILNEKNPNYMENPFISKEVVNSYIEDIWKDMFNNSIREKVKRKSDMFPFDEVMRNFVRDEHLVLDDSDYDLLSNFDGLTNNKWIKSSESSNVVFGKEFNLSASITTDDSTDLEKIARLLQEYIKDNEMQNVQDYAITDQNIDIFLKELLNELEKQETHFVHNVDKFQFNRNDIVSESDGHRNVLLNLTNLLKNLPSEEKESHVSKEDGPISNLRRDFIPGINFDKPKSKPPPKVKISKYNSDMCANCAYFVLSPSIFCMIMSLKTGLVWLFNIIIAILVWFNGKDIDILLKPKGFFSRISITQK